MYLIVTNPSVQQVSLCIKIIYDTFELCTMHCLYFLNVLFSIIPGCVGRGNLVLLQGAQSLLVLLDGLLVLLDLELMLFDFLLEVQMQLRELFLLQLPATQRSKSDSSSSEGNFPGNVCRSKLFASSIKLGRCS